ncbi:MAG TPA: hypothetical protein VLW84_07480 [Terriglobales bacterium]|nr:hypothetical protein [Terriglobales bacterium]
MKLGTENRNKTIVAGVLLVLALLLVARWIFSSPSGPTHAATISDSGTRAANTTARPATGKTKALSTARSLDPTLRYDWLKAAEDTKYSGSGRNIFKAQVDIPKPVVNPAKLPPPPPVPQGPPPPPPINLKYFGFSNHPGEPRKAFLSKDGDVFIAKEGEIIDRRYRILRITPVSVEVEDVLYNNRQSIPLTQG